MELSEGIQKSISINTNNDTNNKSMLEFTAKTGHIFSPTRLRMILIVLARTVAPAMLRIYYAFLQQHRCLLEFLRNYYYYYVTAVQIRKQITASSSSLTSNADQSVSLTAIVPEPSVECQILHEPENGEVISNVVFIHGLHGGIDKTWRQGKWSAQRGFFFADGLPLNLSKDSTLSEDEEQDCFGFTSDNGVYYTNCWPQDWIPQDCPGARVIALNYTTDVLWAPIWCRKRVRTDLVQRSNEMINELIRLGVGVDQRPIIWVGHSKGGLFIKQILVSMWERKEAILQEQIPIKWGINLLEYTRGIMFYSVPHRGSILADLALPLFRRSVELMEIKKNCSSVLDLHERFLTVCRSADFNGEIFSFIETSLTFMTFLYMRIVAYESADPGIGAKCGVPLDHRDICKPTDRHCFLYRQLINLINKYSNNLLDTNASFN